MNTLKLAVLNDLTANKLVALAALKAETALAPKIGFPILFMRKDMVIF